MDAKADADIVGVRPALAHKNVTLVTHMKVMRLETDPSGRQVGAIVAERGAEPSIASRRTWWWSKLIRSRPADARRFARAREYAQNG